jgi:hypothetical protein
MTKVWVDNVGWVSIVLVRDGSMKKIVGDDAGLPGTTKH